jgi:hypothetical protein
MKLPGKIRDFKGSVRGRIRWPADRPRPDYKVFVVADHHTAYLAIRFSGYGTLHVSSFEFRWTSITVTHI